MPGRVAQIPGMLVPPQVWEKLASHRRPEDQEKAGLELAIETVRWIRSEGWGGVCVVSPRVYRQAMDILAASK